MQVKYTLRDWRTLGLCQKSYIHRPGGGRYGAVAVNSDGLVAVTDEGNKCVHLFTKAGALVGSIGKGVLGGLLPGVVFDLKGNVWVTVFDNNKVVKLSQDGQLLQTIRHAGSKSDRFKNPNGMSVSPEGLMYICDTGKHCVTVHDEDGKFLFSFGSQGNFPGSLEGPLDVAFGPDGLVYVSDGSKRICVWSKVGNFERDFRPKCKPLAIAATSDNHLLITSPSSHTTMVYTLSGELVHELEKDAFFSATRAAPCAVHVDDSGLVYVVDKNKLCVQVF